MILRRVAQLVVEVIERIGEYSLVKALFSLLAFLLWPVRYFFGVVGLSAVLAFIWKEFVELFEWGHTVEAEDPVSGDTFPEYHIRPVAVGYGKLMGGMLVRDNKLRSGCIPAVLLLVSASVLFSSVGYGAYWYSGWEEVPAVAYEDDRFKIDYHWRYRGGDLRPVHRSVVPSQSLLSELLGTPEDIRRLKEHFEGREGSYVIPVDSNGKLRFDRTILIEDLPDFLRDQSTQL